MSDPSARKTRERALLDSFLTASGIATTVQERESPDFAIEHDGRTIGIEVSELFQPNSPDGIPHQARESVARKIVQLAQGKFTSDGGPSLRVSVGFPQYSPIERVHRETAAQQLSSLVRKLIAQSGEVLEWRPRNREDLALAELFSYVHVYRHPSHFRSHWLVAAAGWVSPLDVAHLQSRINEKAKRLSAYRRVMPEIWLLLGVWGREPSQFFDMESPPSSNEVHSPFDRTFFYDAFLRKVLPLGVAQ